MIRKLWRKLFGEPIWLKVYGHIPVHKNRVFYTSEGLKMAKIDGLWHEIGEPGISQRFKDVYTIEWWPR